MRRTIIISLAALLLASCSFNKNEQLEIVSTGMPGQFSASMQAGPSKVYMDSYDCFRWNAGDCISVFGSATNSKYSFDGRDGDNIGTFSLVSGEEGKSGYSRYYSVYPYSSAATSSTEGKIGIMLPSTQYYSGKILSDNVMVAVTESLDDENLKFRNVCGYLMLSLFSGLQPSVTSISISGNNGEDLCGAAVISASADDAPSIEFTDGLKEITLDCGASGVKIGKNKSSATEFFLMLPPVEFTKGFTLKLEDAAGGKFERKTENSVTISRNTILPMAVLSVDPSTSSINGTPILSGNNVCGLITDSMTGEGVPGVVVSDCFHCTVTDANGVYQMVADPRAYAIGYSLPAGYDHNLNATTKLPVFFANDLDLEAVNRRDFVLTPRTAEISDFAFAAIGDVHIGKGSFGISTSGESQRYKESLLADLSSNFDEGIKSSKYPSEVFAISLGDLTNDNDGDEWAKYYSAVQNLQRPGGPYIPFYQVIGNHDHRPSGDFYVQRKNYSSYFGPANYSFNIGKAHIIVMDDADLSQYIIRSEDYNWLVEDLSYVEDKEDKIVLLYMHVPLRDGKTHDSSKSINTYRTDIFNQLKAFNQAHIFEGHTHRMQEWVHTEVTTAGGYPIYEHIHAMCGGHYWQARISTDGSPFSYSVYTVRGNEITDFQFKPVGYSTDFQMRVYDGNQIITNPNNVKFNWYTNTLVDSSNGYYTYGNAALQGAFVVSIWKSDTENWDFEFWQNGVKKGNLTRVPSDICDVFTASWFYGGHNGNYDCIRKDTQHYFYYKPESGNPASETNWTIKAVHHVPSSAGVTHTYECSTISSTYDGFAW